MRFSRKSRLPVLVAAVVLVAATASGGTGHRQTVGTLSSVLQNSVFLRGRLASSPAQLFAGESVRTDRGGRAKLALFLKKTVCNVFANSLLTVRPHGNIGLELIRGKVWCGTHRFRKRERFTGPNGQPQISAQDPVFALTITPRKTVVKVWAGYVVVGGPTQSVIVWRHEQTSVTRGGDPAQPTAATLTRQDRAVAQALQSSIGAPTDTTPPVTILDSHPAADTNLTSASFAFEANETGAVFECSLDGQLFQVCASPDGFFGLTDGNHEFSVRAVDAAGNVGAAVTFAWTVDTIPPITVILKRPAAASPFRSATFDFQSNEPNSTFTCGLDKSAPVACTSPQSYVLKDGTHTFQVQATDQAGNTGQPATVTWVVDTVPPQVAITDGPGNASGDVVFNNLSATFTFAANDPSAALTCQLDGGGFKSCSSPATYNGLSYGQHVFDVEAADPAGNTAAASYSWTIEYLG